jgi:hypothetical protein
MLVSPSVTRFRDSLATVAQMFPPPAPYCSLQSTVLPVVYATLYSPEPSIHRCLPFLKRNRVGAFCRGGRIGGTHDYPLRRVMFIFCNEIICPFLFSPADPISGLSVCSSLLVRRGWEKPISEDKRAREMGPNCIPLS